MKLTDGSELALTPREQALFTASTLAQFADAFRKIGANESADIAMRHHSALRAAFEIPNCPVFMPSEVDQISKAIEKEGGE